MHQVQTVFFQVETALHDPLSDINKLLCHSCTYLFALNEGVAVLFWPKIIIVSFVHLMVFVDKAFIVC